MQATAEKLEGSRVRLKVEIAPEDLRKEYERAVRRVANRVNIPGFRRGKAPRRIVENVAGTETVLREMVEHLVPRAYGDAIEQTGVEPIGQPDVDLPDQPALDKPLVFSAEVAVAPTVELDDTADLEIARDEVAVEDSEIASRLEEVRESGATWHPVERAAVFGNRVRLQITISGEGIETSPAQPYQVVLGDNGFPTGFDGAVEGRSAGDTSEFVADIPADDANQHLRGKSARFEIKVEEVSERQVPELDDDFARNVAGVEDFEALRASLRDALLDEKRHQAQHKLDEDALNALVGRASFDIPDVLIESEQRELIESNTQALVRQGVAVDTYLGLTNQTREDWEGQARDDALRRIKRGLVLDAYAGRVGVEADPDEVEREIERVAGTYPEARRDTVRRGLQQAESRTRVENSIRGRQALARLVHDATGGQAPLHDHGESHEPPSEVVEAAEAALVAGADDASSATQPSDPPTAAADPPPANVRED
jgi:trigger factor